MLDMLRLTLAAMTAAVAVTAAAVAVHLARLLATLWRNLH